MLFDVLNHQWSKEILEAAGLPVERLAIPASIRGNNRNHFKPENGYRIGI